MIQTYLLCESDEPSVCQLVTCAFHLYEATLEMALWIKCLRLAEQETSSNCLCGRIGTFEVSGMISLICRGALKLCELQMMAFLVIKTDRELQ